MSGKVAWDVIGTCHELLETAVDLFFNWYRGWSESEDSYGSFSILFHLLI